MTILVLLFRSILLNLSYKSLNKFMLFIKSFFLCILFVFLYGDGIKETTDVSPMSETLFDNRRYLRRLKCIGRLVNPGKRVPSHDLRAMEIARACWPTVEPALGNARQGPRDSLIWKCARHCERGFPTWKILLMSKIDVKSIYYAPDKNSLAAVRSEASKSETALTLLI